MPRATVPARQAHRRARFLLGSVALGPILAVLALAVAARGGSLAAPADQVGHDRAMAEVAARDFLAGRPTALPYAQGLDPYLGRGPGVGPTTTGATGAATAVAASAGGLDGSPAAIPYRALAWRSASEGTVAGQSYEMDTFLVATGTALWHLTIQIIDAAAGPVIGADPSLEPDPTAPAATVGALGYRGLAGANQPDLGPGAMRQIQAWAAAYVGGDGATLYRLTGDTRGDTYPSLQGWVLDRATVLGSVVNKGAALAQIQVVMHEGADAAQSITSGYDLLIEDLGQNLPFVQAWGPPGTGPALVPFANAVP